MEFSLYPPCYYALTKYRTKNENVTSHNVLLHTIVHKRESMTLQDFETLDEAQKGLCQRACRNIQTRKDRRVDVFVLIFFA